MNLYKDYLNEINERKKQDLQPKPIDNGELIKEIILNIEDEKCIYRKDSINFFIYNYLLLIFYNKFDIYNLFWNKYA